MTGDTKQLARLDTLSSSVLRSRLTGLSARLDSRSGSVLLIRGFTVIVVFNRPAPRTGIFQKA